MPSSTLETFPNPQPRTRLSDRDPLPRVHLGLSEDRACPTSARSASPTSPTPSCIELKALKFYMIEFRNRGIFYEAVTNQILDDLVAACRPRRMTVVGDFSARGGITTTVTATYEQA